MLRLAGVANAGMAIGFGALAEQRPQDELPGA